MKIGFRRRSPECRVNPVVASKKRWGKVLRKSCMLLAK